MKPRTVLDFFKTKSGKLLLFAAVFGGGLLIFSVLRNRAGRGPEVAVTPLGTNQTDKPQIVQTVERPMQPFYPPPPKPEPPPPTPTTNEPPKVAAQKQEPPPATLAPISLFADATAGVIEPKSLSSVYAPFGRLISCETVITVDSTSIQTPIMGLVTEDVYHRGKLVIPAGTEVHGTAQADPPDIEHLARGHAERQQAERDDQGPRDHRQHEDQREARPGDRSEARGKHQQADQETCVGAHHRIPRRHNQTNSSQYPQRPTTSNHTRNNLNEDVHPLGQRYQAAILARIVDCPEPKFRENASPPQKKAGNSERHDRAAVERGSLHESFL